MKTVQLSRHSLRFLAVALVLAGCAKTTTSNAGDAPNGDRTPDTPMDSRRSEADAVPCDEVELKCVIDDEDWKHIRARHCSGCTDKKSVFIGEYCEDKFAAESFCDSILKASDCVAHVATNNYIVAEATLTRKIGKNRATECSETSEGTVVFKTDGDKVHTQYPGRPGGKESSGPR